MAHLLEQGVMIKNHLSEGLKKNKNKKTVPCRPLIHSTLHKEGSVRFTVWLCDEQLKHILLWIQMQGKKGWIRQIKGGGAVWHVT